MSVSQRPLNSSAFNIARDGAAKRTQETIAPAHGMRSRSAPGASSALGTPEHAGVQPLDDEKLQKSWEGKEIPVHSGTPSRDKRGVNVPGQASAVLTEAANLGRKA